MGKTQYEDVIESLNALQDGTSTRPIDKNDIKRMVSLHLKQKNIQKPISASADTTDMEISKKLKNKNKKKDSTIADKSPFTQHFKDIQRDVSMDIEDKFESESLSEFVITLDFRTIKYQNTIRLPVYLINPIIIGF